MCNHLLGVPLLATLPRPSQRLAGPLAAPPRLSVTRLEVVGEVIDPFAEDRDLDFGRSGVLVVQTVGLDDARLGSCCQSMYLLNWLARVPLASRTPALGQTRVYPKTSNR